MIVTLKPVRYEAVQYTSPEQSPLPPLVIVATKDSLEESRQKVDIGDWIVKCIPVEGKLPGLKTRNETGYWIISDKQFSELFEGMVK